MLKVLGSTLGIKMGVGVIKLENILCNLTFLRTQIITVKTESCQLWEMQFNKNRDEIVVEFLK